VLHPGLNHSAGWVPKKCQRRGEGFRSRFCRGKPANQHQVSAAYRATRALAINSVVGGAAMRPTPTRRRCVLSALYFLLAIVVSAEEDDGTSGAVAAASSAADCPPGFLCIPASDGDGRGGDHDDEHQGASSSDYIISLVLLAHSGMFSGLTLGLMSLDLAGLRIVISGGTEEEAANALMILPLRKRGNLLLCTLLIGNTLVNAAFAIFSASFTGGLAGTLISTSFIVVIGEITPQSICARHGLRIGSASIPLVRFYMIVLFPFAWPIALALDKLLGEEMGTVYNKKELEMLMQMHVDDEETPLTIRDQEIFRGMLSMSDHCVKDIMTRLEDCYMIEVGAQLTFDKMLDIYRRGYTRIPVYKGTKDYIVGLLYTKDLIMVDPEDDLPVERVLEFCNRELLSVDSRTHLDLMFQQVESGRSHLYFVQNKETEVDEATEDVAGVIGIVTLEDVIEELIQKEIVDESDQLRDNTSKTRVHVGEASQLRRIEFFRAMQSADRRADQRDLTLTDGETTAVTSFLAANVKHMTKYHDGSLVPEEMLCESIPPFPFARLGVLFGGCGSFSFFFSEHVTDNIAVGVWFWLPAADMLYVMMAMVMVVDDRCIREALQG
jgi:metal transporter CNNM